ncbi:MAG: DUF2460 domain-containing protein [Burkholderiaceae bacterium]
MAITVYSDVILPNSVIAAGVRGKNLRNNTRSTNGGGYQSVNINWTKTLRQYELGIVPMLVAQWQALEGLHEVTDGGAYGFLMEDPKDCTLDATTGLLYPIVAGVLGGSIGLGYGVPSMRLHKRYTSVGSTRSKDRLITRPKTVALLRGGAPVTLGAGAGQAAINYDTGTVTFVADSSSTVTGVTVGATTQVTLTAALAGLAVGDRLYLAGLTGADSALLNGLSHAITGIAANTYTLSTNTAGKTITAAGSGYKYPQASETLTWSGRFYVPVHFMEDAIDWDLVAGGAADARLLAGPSVVLQEVRE